MEKMDMKKEKSIRERINPKIYDATYILTKTNINVFNNLMDLILGNSHLKVLDLGCGYKPFKILLNERLPNIEYVGVDFSTENAEPDIVLDLNKDTLPFPDGYFDLVILSEVLEHLYNPMHCLEEAIRILKQGGFIFISTPFLYGNHDKEHDYYRYTDLFYRRFSSEKRCEIVSIEKSGSIVSAPIFILNLFLGSLQQKLKNPFIYTFFDDKQSDDVDIRKGSSKF